ncbi:nucleotidyltransferase domain-containing protein [Paenibacillus puerhi]|uniref:nucleotidyltransferase domain-containing protein n=1 Tax=Paenibacillus puerhi TaxID=2692622 RepID=UPI0013577CC3|nr:nucleotidyltransferase family protein [Paenibacillus puerhi]
MIIPFLQALYHLHMPFPRTEEEYRQLMEEIDLFVLSTQVYHLLKAGGRLEETPVWFQQKLKERTAQASYHNMFMKHKEEEILQLFERQGRRVIPLKGIQFAKRYFGNFAARVTSDIDLFVPAAELQQAIALVETLGYEFEIIKDHHARLQKKDGLMVELHWTLDKLQWSELRTEPFWNDAEPLEEFEYVKQLSTLHTFYFICLHGARHQMDSVRYVMDISHMLYTVGDEISFDALMELARKDKTSRRIQAVLSVVYAQFPLLQSIRPLPFEIMDTHWDYEMIRNAKLGVKSNKYYRYKLFFRHFIFDTLKHQMKSVRKAY